MANIALSVMEKAFILSGVEVKILNFFCKFFHFASTNLNYRMTIGAMEEIVKIIVQLNWRLML